MTVMRENIGTLADPKVHYSGIIPLEYELLRDIYTLRMTREIAPLIIAALQAGLAERTDAEIAFVVEEEDGTRYPLHEHLRMEG